MDLTVITPPDPAALPVAGFRAQLRMGTGFADAASEDAELAGFLAAAIAVIEARTGKALLSRSMRLVLSAWRWSDAQALPMAPVSAVAGMAMRNRDGVLSTVAPERWRLKPDRHRPQIVARGALLPAIPPGGQVEIDFSAGFGTDWAEMPADLAQAVFLLAAEYHQARSGVRPDMPQSVSGLVAAWQPVRVSAGGYR